MKNVWRKTVEKEISFVEVSRMFKKGINFILVAMICCVGVMTISNAFIKEPVYQSSVQILVNQTTNTSSEFDTNDIQTNIQLIDTYSVIIESPAVLDEVVSRLGGEVTVKQLQDAITVTSEDGTQVMNIVVSGKDPENVALVANTVAEVFKNEIVEIMQVENVTILSPATIGEKVKPNAMTSTVLAATLGFVIGIVIIFVRGVLDTTVKNEETITELLDLPVLGSISDFDLQEE